MRDTTKLGTSFLDDAMQYASLETRQRVADALACHLHNDGYALEGNSEANDVEWFARNLYERFHNHARAWDRDGDDVKVRYREIARDVLALLPGFQLRIAHRLITLSKVVRDIERAERAQRKSRAARSESRDAGPPPEET